jgi:hypothetical protein
MDADALQEWTRLEDEYDMQVDKNLASIPGGTAPGGESLDLARERLADPQTAAPTRPRSSSSAATRDPIQLRGTGS